MPQQAGSEEKVVMPWEKQYELEAVQDATPDKPATDKTGPMPWEKKYKELPGVTPVRPSYNFSAGKSSSGFDMSDYTRKLTSTESGGNDNAKAATSSATGPHQFIEDTWKETVAKMGANYSLADRTDRAKSTKVLQRFTQDNIEQAKNDLGRTPTQTEAYMYHFIGASAPKLIKAPRDKPAKDYITPDQYRANKAVFEGKTVGEVLNKYEKRFK